MSRRGGKRRQVVQLGSSSSNLHRYGYSKRFMSGDSSASSLKLLGDYSDSESDETGGDGESAAATGEAGIHLNEAYDDLTTDSIIAPTTEGENVEMDAEKGLPSMDDELKNFLSEIEAIPMPPELNNVSSEPASRNSPQTTPSPEHVENEEEPAEPPSEPASVVPAQTAEKKKPNMYAMFVKGDTEFADHTESDRKDKVDKGETEEELDIPDEPTTKWQLVQDEATQYYYYWNWQTNEVTWEIPADYTQYLLLHKEYEGKIAKYSPEQVKAYRDRQQRNQKTQVSESKTVSSHKAPAIGDVSREMIGPQFPNGTVPAEANEDQDSRLSSSHAKKKKSHKKHKKRRHKDQDNEDQGEGVTKASTNNAAANRPSLVLSSIVPYDSDDESDTKENSTTTSEPDTAISQKDLKENSLPATEKGDLNSVESPAGVELQSDNQSLESPSANNESKAIEDTSDTLPAVGSLLAEDSNAKGQSPSASIPEEDLPQSKDSKRLDSESEGSNPDLESLLDLNHDHVTSMAQDSASTTKKENDPVLMQGTTISPAASHSDIADINGTLSAKPTAVTEASLSVPENNQMEVEEGEISDSNDVVCKKLDSSRSQTASPSTDKKLDSSTSQTASPSSDNQKTLSSIKSSLQKDAPENVLNLMGYKSEDEEEEEEEEEEGELVEETRGKTKEDRSSRSHTKMDIVFSDQMEQLKAKDLTERCAKTSAALPASKDQDGDAFGESGQLPEKHNASDSVDDGDIDFDDVEDIDRVLEIALEKKLDRQKAALAAGQEAPRAHSSHIDLVTKPAEDNVEKSDLDKFSKGHSSSKDSEELKAKIKAISDLALNKLDFLEVGANSLSKLQILYVELQTRLKDWHAGGLSTSYIFQQLQQAEGLLEQYEVNAVPDGWLCQWDRTKRRYFYRNIATNQIQLEYPQKERKSSKEEKKSDGDRGRRRERESSEYEDSHKQHSSSRSSRHRKKDDKDRGKHDRRTSDRHRKKRRRRRTHSSSSDSSNETSHQHHHKSKRKKKRKERSPSVELLEHIQAAHVIEDSPPPAPHVSTTPQIHLVDENSVDGPTPDTQAEPAHELASVEPKAARLGQDLVADYSSEADGEKMGGDDVNLENEIDGLMMEEEEEGERQGEAEENSEAKPEEESNASTAVISKPPQIIVPPHVAAMNPPEFYSTFAPATALPPLQPTTSATAPQESPEETSQKADDSDKGGKKKKKEKSGKEKSLTTGSSLMMKKKRVSSMVQKWQQVKKEVEKEDLAKELRQAAIREQINQLK